MPLSEFEIKQCERDLGQFMAAKRPPASIRDKVDFGYRISGQSVEIFEIRPGFRNPNQKVEIPIAKAKYVKAHKHWCVYWHRADMKWHKYSPYPVAKSLKQFLDVVAEDAHHCFFG